MLDDPPARLIEDEVRKARGAGQTSAFAEKVAENALGIARRERELGPILAAEERARLGELLGGEDDLPSLNLALATALREGTLDLHDDAVTDHLIRTAIAKLQVDQPTVNITWDLSQIPIYRMTGQVQAEGFTLAVQPDFIRPGWHHFKGFSRIFRLWR